MRIYTYFDCSPRAPGQGDVIRLWRDSWQHRGWEPRILNPRTFVAHRWFKPLRKIVRECCADPVDQIRRMRWLALAVAGGGWFCEYDVMNYGFTPPPRNPGFSARSYAPGNPLVYLNKAVCQDIVRCLLGGASEFRAFKEACVYCDCWVDHHVDYGSQFRDTSKTVHFDSDSILERHRLPISKAMVIEAFPRAI